MSIPEVFFRETIDLNRYSNSVAKKYAVTYNEIIVNAAKQLKQIDLRQQAADAGVVIAPQTRKRLRAIIKQSKDSLATWSTKSAIDFKKELQGVTILQKDFIENELKKVTASGDVPINSVAISPKYAESVIMTDPSKVNIFTSKAFAEDNFVNFGSGKFSLTATQGAAIRLPNGTTVSKAFRGLAESSAEKLDLAVRSGVFAGESLDQITRRLVGRLEFADFGPLSVKQLALAGGELTKVANNQISTIVRTSVNQVTNQASQAVYAANKKVAPKYEYVATLDSRTSPICQRLDGQIFDYNKGPTPPQHFNCRSTTVPVVDFDGLQKKYPNLEKPPATKLDTRPSITGRVPQGTPYGNWLLQQDKKLQVKTLGNEGKVNFFKKLAKREGSGQAALRKMIRTDGSERSLKDLERLYGKPRDITIRTKTPKPTVTITNQDKLEETLKAARAAERKAKAELKELKQRNPLQPTIAQLQGIPAKSKVQAVDVNNAFDLMDNMEGLAGANAKKLRKFTEQREVFCAWTSGAETKGLKFAKIDEKIAFLKNNPQLKKSLEKAKARGLKGIKDNAPDIDPLTNIPQLNNKVRVAQGMGKIDEILDGGLGKSGTGGHLYFVRYMTTQKTNAFGYTFQGANHIAMKTKPYYKKVTNLSEIRKAVKQSIQNAAKGTPQGNVDNALYQVTGGIFEPVKITSKTGQSWLTTYVHEMGHQIHYAAGRPAMAGKAWIPSKYGGTNYMEEFAETFVQYVFDPVELKKASPNAYKWVDEAVNVALKAPV